MTIKANTVLLNQNNYLRGNGNTISIISDGIVIPVDGDFEKGVIRFDSSNGKYQIGNGNTFIELSNNEYINRDTFDYKVNQILTPVIIDLIDGSNVLNINISQSKTFVVNVRNSSNVSLNFYNHDNIDVTSFDLILNVGYHLGWGAMDNAWSVNSALFNRSIYIRDYYSENRMEGIYIKDDGTKMFIVGSGDLDSGNAQDYVRELEIPDAWNISSAVYNSKTFRVDTQDAAPSGLFFKPDGTKMFIVGLGSDAVRSYELSDAWNINSAVYSSNSFSVSGQEGSASGLFFKPDGTKMFIVGYTFDIVRSYELSDAWNINSAVYMSNSFSVNAQDGNPHDIFFKPDGTKMFIIGETNSSVYSYELSDAWNINSAVYSSNSFSVALQDVTPSGLFFKPDGLRMFVVGTAQDRINEYLLTDSYDGLIEYNNNIKIPNDITPMSNITRPTKYKTIHQKYINVGDGKIMMIEQANN